MLKLVIYAVSLLLCVTLSLIGFAQQDYALVLAGFAALFIGTVAVLVIMSI